MKLSDSSDAPNLEILPDGTLVGNQILPDGTRVTKRIETQTLPDGSSVVKKRILQQPPATASQNHNPLRKSIKTTITRTDPQGIVQTTTTTEETITAPNELGGETANNTQTYILPDGTGVLEKTITTKLDDGCLSTVVTKVCWKTLNRPTLLI